MSPISGVVNVTAMTPPPAPVVSFTNVTPREGIAPLSVTFNADASTSNPPPWATWRWSFGDGTFSSIKNPTHTYTTANNYTVSLTASNLGGTAVLTRVGYVNVTSVAPVANFTNSTTTPREGRAPLTVTFTDLSTNGPTSWNWTFGDGNVTGATLRNPVHTYWAGGLYNVSLNASNAGGSNVSTQVGYINVTSRSSRISVFNNGNGQWSIDYNGNNTWDGAPPDKLVSFGAVGDIPVKGDWNSNFMDEIGLFRSPGVWILDANGNYIWDGPVTDRMFGFGAIGDQPVVGEWTRNGTTKIGVFRSPGVWILDYNGNYIFDGTPTDQIIGFGAIGDVPVVGDWNRDGHKEIAVFRSPGVWVLDYNGNNIFDGTPTDWIIAFGAVGDTPVVGDWNGDGLDEVGLYRNGIWILDYNANYIWDGPTLDRILAYSPNGGTVPQVGNWN